MITPSPIRPVSRIVQFPVQQQVASRLNSLTPLPVDQICFSGTETALDPLVQRAIRAAKSNRSDKEKLEATHKEALALFKKYKGNPDGLLAEMERQGVLVLRTEDDPKVKEILEYRSANGMMHPPSSYSKALGEVVQDANWKNPDENSSVYPMLLEIDRSGKFAILLKSPAKPPWRELQWTNIRTWIPALVDQFKFDKYRKDDYRKARERYGCTVFHEVFHLLQWLNGLRYLDKGSTEKTDYEADRFVSGEIGDPHWEFNDDLKVRTGWIRKDLFPKGWRLLESWESTVKRFWKRHGLQEDPAGLGATVRGRCQVEMDTYDFVARHYKDLGLPKWTRDVNKYKYAHYERVFLKSYYLDLKAKTAETQA